MSETGTGIAPWRIDSGFERWLSRKADTSVRWKKLYLSYYKAKDRAYFEKGVEMAEREIERFGVSVDPSQRAEVVDDMIYSLHRFGCMYEEYFWYGFPYLSARGRSSFITDKIRYSYYSELNADGDPDLFQNKWRTFKRFPGAFGRECMEVSCEGDRESFREFCQKHRDIIVKPLRGCCGKGAGVWRDMEDAGSAFDQIVAIGGGSMVEELVKQVPEMAQFHPDSVNTVRIPVLIDTEGNPRVFHPFFRTGRGGASVDNAGAGGIFANVNAETGVCETLAVDEVGRTYALHPDSGIPLTGFRIPRWGEAVDLASRLTVEAEGYRFVGWDLALTERGWVVIEGNSKSQFISQIADKKGVLDEFLNLAFGDIRRDR